jgi:hypothetical protein
MGWGEARWLFFGATLVFLLFLFLLRKKALGLVPNQLLLQGICGTLCFLNWCQYHRTLFLPVLFIDLNSWLLTSQCFVGRSLIVSYFYAARSFLVLPVLLPAGEAIKKLATPLPGTRMFRS